MKYNQMHTVDSLAIKIKEGGCFIVAGDEKIIDQLPVGNWIGGTIPYFMTQAGGTISRELIFATELPSYCKLSSIKLYDELTIASVYQQIPSSGFGIALIPASSKVHMSFATQAPEYIDFAAKPLIGWISGVHLDDIGTSSAKIFSGQTKEKSDVKAIVMHVELDNDYICEVGIANIFSQGLGDTIEFLETGFSVTDALVNGQKVNFADYIKKNKVDIKYPLVANYAGAMINVSFQDVDNKRNAVDFYAPIFSNVKYRQAAPITNYVSAFMKALPENSEHIIFSCNCILNFIYSELEGKKTGQIVGPMTFGELAYQLLNQTLVYLKIDKI
jgi:hypothetical protein